MSRRIFVSYAREDSAAVIELARDLRSAGHEVWLDRDLTGGQDWWTTILERIRWCEVFVVGLSDPFLRSVACAQELDYAQALRRVVLPVRVGTLRHETLIHPVLGRRQHIVWRGDKPTVLHLLGAVARLDAAPALPRRAPAPPPVPLSYLATLRVEIVGRDALDVHRQFGIAGSLRDEAQNTDQIAEVMELVALLRERRDLSSRVDRQLQRLLDDLGVVDPARPEARTEPPRVEPAPARGPVPSSAPTTTGPFDVVVTTRTRRLVRLQLRGSGWMSTVEIRTGWRTHVVHDGIDRVTSKGAIDGLYVDYASLELPGGDTIAVAVHSSLGTLTLVQLRRLGGWVIFENKR